MFANTKVNVCGFYVGNLSSCIENSKIYHLQDIMYTLQFVNVLYKVYQLLVTVETNN